MVTRIASWSAIALILLVASAPQARAQLSGHGPSSQDCTQETLVGLVGITSAGNIEACIFYPGQVLTGTSMFTAVAELTAPAATGIGTATMTTTWAATTGCTLSGTQTNGGPGGTGFGTDFWSYQAVQLTAQQCNLRAQVTYANGAGTVLFSMPFQATVLSVDAKRVIEAQDRLCAASTLNTGATCTNPLVEQQNRLCKASQFGATCKDPKENVTATAANNFATDFAGMVITYAPPVLGALLLVAWRRTGDPAFALMGTLLVLYSATAFPWWKGVKAVLMVLAVYLVAKMLWTHEQERRKKHV
ncbi:MAG: hypothetical protein ACYDBQ_02160 [Thermoplasmatota archaeon]